MTPWHFTVYMASWGLLLVTVCSRCSVRWGLGPSAKLGGTSRVAAFGLFLLCCPERGYDASSLGK